MIHATVDTKYWKLPSISSVINLQIYYSYQRNVLKPFEMKILSPRTNWRLRGTSQWIRGFNIWWA